MRIVPKIAKIKNNAVIWKNLNPPLMMKVITADIFVMRTQYLKTQNLLKNLYKIYTRGDPCVRARKLFKTICLLKSSIWY